MPRHRGGADWVCLRQSLKHVTLPTLKPLLLRFVESFPAQVSPTAACNGRHKAEHRLARRLLMTHDRISGGGYPMKHEFLSAMLGGVTITGQAKTKSDDTLLAPARRFVATSCRLYWFRNTGDALILIE